LFGRNELDALLAYFTKQVPKLVEELTPKILPLTTVHSVLCGLLAERVPIRDLRNIITALIESAAVTQDPRGLLATIRVKLGGFILQNLFGAVGELKVAALEPDLEKLLYEILRLSAGSGVFAVEPALAGELRAAAALLAGRLGTIAPVAGLVTRAELREAVAGLLRSVRPRIWVFSFNEIPAEKQIKVVGLLGRSAQTHG
jgi:flagellar biosynthesis protein FlhA